MRGLTGLVFLLTFIPAGLGGSQAQTSCPAQPLHTYVMESPPGWEDTQTGISRVVAAVVVWDTNVADCDGDGRVPDFDGDADAGVGGAFFGYGRWADEPVCRYGLNEHPNGASVLSLPSHLTVYFIGADDTLGPRVVADPDDPGDLDCFTDGTISPDTDLDDCLMGPYQWPEEGRGCGGGGDGGFWVIILATYAWSDPQSVGMWGQPDPVGFVGAVEGSVSRTYEGSADITTARR